jgi:hypothetical protein
LLLLGYDECVFFIIRISLSLPLRYGNFAWISTEYKLYSSYGEDAVTNI